MIAESENIPEEFLDKAEKIWEAERNIDMNRAVYLITWAPDPKDLPDCDFDLQHRANVNILADYLRCCSAGVFCVEATQKGNPHYHGWYQTNPLREKQRIVFQKTLDRFGLSKIAKASSVQIHRWSKHANALFYYKEELLEEHLFTPLNPVTIESHDDTDWNGLWFVGMKKNQYKTVVDRMADYKYYETFYKDSMD